jgi:hypothetical protein
VESCGPPLKQTAAALDSQRAMRVQELKLLVEGANYTVDPAAVADAMIRRAVSHRRCWKPRTACGSPPALSTTSAGPSPTEPIQVTSAPEPRLAAAPHTQSS